MGKIVKLILDTDLGADCDDVGALCLAFELEREKKCELLAVGHCVKDEHGVATVSVLKNYYNQHFPIGRYTGPDYKNDNCRHIYDKKINEVYSKYLDANTNYLDAYKLYRKVLAKEKDHSVTIVTIGELSNIAALLESQGDEFSPLTGIELLNNKVSRIVVMGGAFVDNSEIVKALPVDHFPEYNLVTDLNSTKTFLEHVKTEVVFLDFYDGKLVETVGFCKDEKWKSPLVDAYRYYCDGPRSSWDLLTVYWAVTEELFDKIGPGTVFVNEGLSTFTANSEGKHYYLRPSKSIDEITSIIDEKLIKLETFIVQDRKRNLKKIAKKEKALELKRRELNYQRVAAKGFEQSKKVKIAPKDSIISLQNVNKIYPNLVQAVFDFNIEVKDKEFIVFVGPSGCGKSTTLRMIAGLEDITAGDLYIDRKYANDMLPKKRNISMVFQSYALYPNMTVRENLSFGLKIKHVKKEEIRKRVEDAARVLEIYDYLDRKPSALSGGQRQRVALGRAIVKASPVFLMDEPLSNLDAKLRVQMRSEIVALHKKVGSTTIYVTHDQTEAMTMADRIVVMSKGRVQQIGTPDEVYSKPNNLFVATFIGAPAMNICNAVYHDNEVSFEDNYSITLNKNRVKTIDKYIDEQIKKKENLISQTKQSIADRIDYLTYKSVRYQKDAINNLEKKYANKEQLIRTNISNMEKAIEGGDYNGTNEALAELNKDLEILLINKAKEKALIDNRIAHFQRLERDNTSKDKEKIQAIIDIDKELEIYNSDIQKYQTDIEYYKEAKDKNVLDIKFGIRPEDIYCLSSKERAETSTKEFKSQLSFVELLGYEYYLHFDFNGVKFISKASNGKYKFESGTIEKFQFDEDKIHAFDSKSGDLLF